MNFEIAVGYTRVFLIETRVCNKIEQKMKYYNTVKVEKFNSLEILEEVLFLIKV